MEKILSQRGLSSCSSMATLQRNLLICQDIALSAYQVNRIDLIKPLELLPARDTGKKAASKGEKEGLAVRRNACLPARTELPRNGTVDPQGL